jgi:hypothetical protein
MQAGLLATWHRLALACGSRWTLSDLVISRPGSCGHAAAAALSSAAAPAAAAPAPEEPPADSARGPPEQHAGRDAALLSTSATLQPPSRSRGARDPTRAGSVGAALAAPARAPTPALRRRTAGELTPQQRGALAAGGSASAAGGPLQGALPISEGTLMALIKEAEALARLEQLLAQHGPYFR